MAQGNKPRRNITDLINNIYASEYNIEVNNILLKKLTLEVEFSNKEIKDIYNYLIFVFLNEVNTFGNVNIHNFGSFRLSNPRNKKTIKLNFNKIVKTKIKELNILYINKELDIPLCDSATNLIAYTKEVNMPMILKKELNLFLKKCQTEDKSISKSGFVWKYILVEFYELFFLKAFEHITTLLFEHYMINVDPIGGFCFKYNSKFGLYIRYIPYEEKV